MNFEFAEQINPDLERLDFEKALQFAENELRKIPLTEFHFVLDNSLLDQTNDLASWTENFYNLATKKNKVEALYFEMNEFDINTDYWYIDSFAFENDGGLDLENMDWLSDFDTDSQTETKTVFKIDGYEKLQKAFENIELETANLQNARDWCEQIIITRFMELLRIAHLTAKSRNLNWGKIPIYFTEHSYEFIAKSETT
jgi:hypothetical protein